MYFTMFQWQSIYHIITLILSFCERERQGHGIIMGVLHPLLLESVLFRGSRCCASIMMPHTYSTGSVLWLSYEVSFVSVPAKECSKIEEILEGTGTGYPTINLVKVCKLVENRTMIWDWVPMILHNYLLLAITMFWKSSKEKVKLYNYNYCLLFFI